MPTWITAALTFLSNFLPAGYQVAAQTAINDLPLIEEGAQVASKLLQDAHTAINTLTGKGQTTAQATAIVSTVIQAATQAVNGDASALKAVADQLVDQAKGSL